jgi:hypothetical protein
LVRVNEPAATQFPHAFVLLVTYVLNTIWIRCSAAGKFSDPEFVQLGQAMSLRAWSEGETIIAEGEAGNEFFIIQSVCSHRVVFTFFSDVLLVLMHPIPVCSHDRVRRVSTVTNGRN